MMRGKITKGIAGFYYVKIITDVVEGKAELYECKAKGIFRKNAQKPLVGDVVDISILDEEKRIGNIEELYPRKNSLIRPAVANIDQALVFFAIKHPDLNLNLLDRFLIMMEKLELPIVLCFNKKDLVDQAEMDRVRNIYEKCGYPVHFMSAKDKNDALAIKKLLLGKTTVLAGPSGAGKSTFVNQIQQEFTQTTGELSEKIKRGKNTTTHTQFMELDDTSYIIDTPGFSSMGIFEIEETDLGEYYPEFRKYEKFCKFTRCAHTKEPVCGIKDAVERGEIAKERYENYILLYDELKEKRKY